MKSILVPFFPLHHSFSSFLVCHFVVPFWLQFFVLFCFFFLSQYHQKSKQNGIRTCTSGKKVSVHVPPTKRYLYKHLWRQQCISKRNRICTSTSGELVSLQYQMKNQVMIRAKLGAYLPFMFSSLFYRCISFLSNMTTMNAG